MRRLAPLLLLALVVAACGSSSSKDGGKTTSTTQDSSYVAAGNAVCIRADKRVVKIGRLTRAPQGWAKTAAAARTGVLEMRKVHPPAQRAAAFQQMLKYGNALELALQEVRNALVKGDIDTAAAAQLAAARIQDKVHSSAKLAGLTFCQQALTNWPA